MNKRFIVSVVILCLYMRIIFWPSSLPNDQLIPEKDLWGIIIPQTIKHLVEYSILGFLMSLVVSQTSIKKTSTSFYSFIFSSGYDISDEIHQYFVPTRYCTVFDMCVNSIGSIVGVLFYVVVIYFYTRE